MKKKLSKKNLALSICIPVLVVAIVATAVGLTWQIPLKYDESAVQKLSTDVVKTDWNGYTALAKDNGEFKIMNFTDTHLCDRQEKNRMTLDCMIAAIVAEKPDLVTLSGDIVTSSFNKKRVEQFGELMENLGIYWAPILGNHEGDAIGSVARDEVVSMWSSCEHCLMHNDNSEISGNGNYVVVLLDGDRNPVESLYFIDTHDEISDADAAKFNVEPETYDYIKADQIAWYSSTVADINAKAQTAVKSVMYIHIPLCEYQIAYDELSADGEIELNKPTENGTVMLYGAKYESICCSKYNSGMFDAILAGSSTEMVICGHDHINNFILQYKGIILAYAEASGYGTYTMESRGFGDNINGYTIVSVGSSATAISSFVY